MEKEIVIENYIDTPVQKIIETEVEHIVEKKVEHIIEQPCFIEKFIDK